MANEVKKVSAKERNIVKLSDIFNWDPRGAFVNAIKSVFIPEAGKLFVNIVDSIAKYLVYDSTVTKTSSDGRYKNYGSYYDNGQRVVLKAREDNRYDISRIAIPNRGIANDIYDLMVEREKASRDGVVTLFDFYDIASNFLDGLGTQTTDRSYGWLQFSKKVDIASCPEGWYFRAPKPTQFD